MPAPESVHKMDLTKYKDKIYFISDTHIGHCNIIKYCNRPFSCIEDMNQTIINNWNKVVPEDGIVFHLGDVTLKSPSSVVEIFKSLNGLKYLIKGNHDIKLHQYGSVFHEISEQKTIKIENEIIHLNHFPLLCFPENHINLFGHVHLSKTKNEGSDFERCTHLTPNQYDIGCDFNDYTPISWNEVYEKIKFQRKNNVSCLYWI